MNDWRTEQRKKVVLAKYGEWESIIGGIIDWIAPQAKFLGDHQQNTLAVDSEKEETIVFLKQLMNVFPNCGTTAMQRVPDHVESVP